MTNLYQGQGMGPQTFYVPPDGAGGPGSMNSMQGGPMGVTGSASVSVGANGVQGTAASLLVIAAGLYILYFATRSAQGSR
jgi:hypothetical protein